MGFFLFGGGVLDLSLGFWGTTGPNSVQGVSGCTSIFDCTWNLVVRDQGVCLTLGDGSFLERTCGSAHDVANVVCLAEVLSCLGEKGTESFC